MKIIKRTADKIVLYAGDDLVLDETGASGRYSARTIRVPGPEVETTRQVPVFVDGVFTGATVNEVVMVPGPDVEQTELVPDWRDANTTTANAQLIDNVTIPADFIGGAYKHTTANGFEVVDASRIDALLAPVRAAMWERIKAHRDRLSTEGGYKVGTKWFHSDAKSQTQQLGLVMMGANVPPVPWKTMDGSKVTMTQALAGQIFAAAAAQDMAIFAKAEDHRAAMEASNNPAAYDFSGGWPETFAP